MDNFCPNCRILILPKEENNGVFLKCNVCGYSKEFSGWTNHQCNECDHTKAVVLYHEMVKGDEGTTTIFRCLNCGSIDKEGNKG